MLSVLLLCSVGAFSQEIRMPDEKRKNYVNENSPSTNNSDQQRREAASKQRQLEAERRQQFSARSEARKEGVSVFCIVRETTSFDAAKTSVEVISDKEFERTVKTLSEQDKERSKALAMVLRSPAYATGLDALNNFSRSGWELVDSNTLTYKEIVVREYLMKFVLP